MAGDRGPGIGRIAAPAHLPDRLLIAPRCEVAGDPLVDRRAGIGVEEGGLPGDEDGPPLTDVTALERRQRARQLADQGLGQPESRPPRWGLSMRARAIWLPTPAPSCSRGLPTVRCRARASSSTRTLSLACSADACLLSRSSAVIAANAPASSKALGSIFISDAANAA